MRPKWVAGSAYPALHDQITTYLYADTSYLWQGLEYHAVSIQKPHDRSARGQLATLERNSRRKGLTREDKKMLPPIHGMSSTRLLKMYFSCLAT